MSGGCRLPLAALAEQRNGNEKPRGMAKQNMSVSRERTPPLPTHALPVLTALPALSLCSPVSSPPQSLLRASPALPTPPLAALPMARPVRPRSSSRDAARARLSIRLFHFAECRKGSREKYLPEGYSSFEGSTLKEVLVVVASWRVLENRVESYVDQTEGALSGTRCYCVGGDNLTTL